MPMGSTSTWRSQLTAVERYENIEKLKKSIEAKGLSSTGNSQKVAFATETDAYNNATSKETYIEACETIVSPGLPADGLNVFQDPVGPGRTIGSYQNCHHIASGLVSEVFRCRVFALKVITETRDVEPHNPSREVKILEQLSHASIIKLQESTKDQDGRLVMVFPFMPLTLAKVIASGSVTGDLTKTCFRDLFSALQYLHGQGVIHRDLKPSNLLLASPMGPACLSDFGTAWHPILSHMDEPPDHKALEVGTTCYRAPETLFGNRSYDTSLDIWEAGTMFVECIRNPATPLFESRETSEDGNQLGLILSMFKTLGTPTKETWPEAVNFTTPPFEWYQEFPGHTWKQLLPSADDTTRDLAESLVCYESGRRLTAVQALQHPYFKE